MVAEKIVLITSKLIDFWRTQKIKILAMPLEEINLVERERELKLPSDFKMFYSMVNGMVDFYPNEIDAEGFLFYPVDAILSVNAEFENCNLTNKDKIFIFAEYMHKSWWYGVELKERNEYVIGIISGSSSFKPITNSLVEFIELYLENSPKLYDYS
jgi:hypothetical protein